MLTWIGEFNGTGAYPTLNRHLTRELEKQGQPILRNIHNDGLDITPIAVSCVYPPQAPSVRHALNVISTNWEFPGATSIPLSFIKAFDRVDLILAHSAWAAAQFRLVTKTPVYATPLGFDPDEFTPDGAMIDWNVIFRDQAWANNPDTKFVLWVGGTDKRHGLDIAIDVISRLPANYHLIAKTSVDYPPASFEAHPRVHTLRHNFGSLAPLYRACDVFLNSARAVGFSMPCLEALACGCQVVSTYCPPVLEFAYGNNPLVATSGQWLPFNHHVHTDCLPQWWQPDIDELVACVLSAHTINCEPSQAWRKQWTWENSARQIVEVLQVVSA